MLDRAVNSLNPVAHMAVGIVLATLSIAVGDRVTSAALLCAACCSMALTGVTWGRREAALARVR